jgi:L-lactate dehydrogenase complex protein LldG
VDIDLPGLLLRVRSGHSPQKPQTKIKEGVGIPPAVKIGLTGYRLAAASSELFAFFQGLGGLLSRIYSPRRSYMHLPAWTGWGYSKDFPRLDVHPFRSHWGKIIQHVENKPIRLQESPKPLDPESRPLGKSLPDRFAEELSALGGHAYIVSGKELPARLAEFMESKRIDRVLVDDDGATFVTGIPTLRQPDPSVRAGVTGALAGIAETGSLLLTSGAGETLKASLLPEIHVVVLKASRILPTLTDALAMPEVGAVAAGVVITGPSRTADIEMTLTIGVHGPGELHVFLIDDSMPV